MPQKELEPSQKRQLENWIEEVREHEHSALKWSETLYRIKLSGYWRSTHKTWPEFCDDNFGYAKAMSYRYTACGRIAYQHREKIAKEAQPPRTVRQIENYGKVQHVRQPNCEYVGTENDLKEDKRMGARQCGDVEHVKPEAPPEPPQSMAVLRVTSVVPAPIIELVNELAREANRLQQQGQLAFDPKFCHLVQGIIRLKQMVQPSLPGMDEHFAKAEPVAASPAKKGKCTEAQAILYCRTLGLPDTDGEWFFAKMEGCGWKNGGKAVADWQQTIRAWKLGGYMASQKHQRVNGDRNGHQPINQQRSAADKFLDRALEESRRLK
jgi:hypothetical protein